jgi:uncharacterized protein with von Willebrand factor type A (vWA) domain
MDSLAPIADPITNPEDLLAYIRALRRLGATVLERTGLDGHLPRPALIEHDRRCQASRSDIEDLWRLVERRRRRLRSHALTLAGIPLSQDATHALHDYLVTIIAQIRDCEVLAREASIFRAMHREPLPTPRGAQPA